MFSYKKRTSTYNRRQSTVRGDTVQVNFRKRTHQDGPESSSQPEQQQQQNEQEKDQQQKEQQVDKDVTTTTTTTTTSTIQQVQVQEQNGAADAQIVDQTQEMEQEQPQPAPLVAPATPMAPAAAATAVQASTPSSKNVENNNDGVGVPSPTMASTDSAISMMGSMKLHSPTGSPSSTSTTTTTTTAATATLTPGRNNVQTQPDVPFADASLPPMDHTSSSSSVNNNDKTPQAIKKKAKLDHVVDNSNDNNNNNIIVPLAMPLSQPPPQQQQQQESIKISIAKDTKDMLEIIKGIATKQLNTTPANFKKTLREICKNFTIEVSKIPVEKVSDINEQHQQRQQQSQLTMFRNYKNMEVEKRISTLHTLIERWRQEERHWQNILSQFSNQNGSGANAFSNGNANFGSSVILKTPSRPTRTGATTHFNSTTKKKPAPQIQPFSTPLVVKHNLTSSFLSTLSQPDATPARQPQSQATGQAAAPAPAPVARKEDPRITALRESILSITMRVDEVGPRLKQVEQRAIEIQQFYADLSHHFHNELFVNKHPDINQPGKLINNLKSLALAANELEQS
ncbi:hypothetical protein SAMD00019534_017390 [Acytostelium subglobosum LB1]|uniref:hypothetical protein n=1 Tax=Acytostelium subglobosum LB1 TaxID=1410327 RepID=UPI0006449849|nr:hypothetical protein SAMD00019534_017390 [Acytostelium subglobosum LB1]GAM18564.1 hypothetical protein SAMD00019534_017390 [Acytostelium subglobosum LB1]|eukprot:XP_012757784.1 hypothetical protein SAMD00019534_017390 [Acytostelium subglobosum LB1]